MQIIIIFTILLTLLFIKTYTESQEDEVPLETKECRERDRLIASENEDLYSLVDAVEGQTITLQCRFCKEEPSDTPKNWYKIDQLGVSNASEVKLDMNNDIEQNRIMVNHKHSLVIKNFTAQDMGYYFCVHFEDQSNSEKFNFLIDIVMPDKEGPVEKGSITDWSKYHDDFFISVNKLFKESSATEFVYIREILKIDAELISQWAPWGPCQVCGRPEGEGVMKKRGACRIKLTPHSEAVKDLSSDEMYLLKAPAISCKSRRLRRIFPTISNYTINVPDFIQEDKCSGVCNPDAEGINQGWKVGKGKGFKYRKHSVLQESSHLTFVCPESTLDNKVVWKKNGKVLKRGDNSYPHVMVDAFNTLYLIEVTPVDKGNYTCYVDDIRMQQIVVFVYSKSKLLTNELLRYLIYLGFILFLSSFCYCGGLVVTYQRRHVFKTYEDLKKEEPQNNVDEFESLL